MLARAGFLAAVLFAGFVLLAVAAEQTAPFDRSAAIRHLTEQLQARSQAMKGLEADWRLKAADLNARKQRGEQDLDAELKALDRISSVWLESLQQDALRIVEENPADEAAFMAIKVVLEREGHRLDSLKLEEDRRASSALCDRMAQVLLDHHLGRADLFGDAVQPLIPDGLTLYVARGDFPAVRAFLRKTLDVSPHAQVKERATRYLLGAYTRQLSGSHADDVRGEAEAFAREVSVHHKDNPSLSRQAENLLNRFSVTEGKTFPDVSLTGLDGKPDALSRYRGKVVLIDFWATWCKPCVAAHPDMLEFYQEMAGRNFEIIAISLDEERQALVKYITGKHKLPWVNWHHGNLPEAARRWNINSVPAYFVLDAQGVIRNRSNSFDADSQNLIRKLVGEGEASPRPANAYAPLVKEANERFRGARLALSRDGCWLAIATREGVTVTAVPTGSSRPLSYAVPVPASKPCSRLSWNPAGDLLALACRSTQDAAVPEIFVWRRGAATVAEVGKSTAYIPMLHWLASGQLLYVTEQERYRPLPVMRTAASDPMAAFPCTTAAFFGQIAAAKCDSATDVFQSRARVAGRTALASGAGTSPGARTRLAAARPQPEPLMRQVMVFDAATGKQTVTATIRGPMRSLSLAPDEKQLIVSVDTTPYYTAGYNSAFTSDYLQNMWSGVFTDVRIHALPLRQARSGTTPSVFDVSGASSPDAGIVLLTEASVPSAPDPQLAVSPAGNAVAWGNFSSFEASDTVFITPLSPRAKPALSVTLDPPADDPVRGMQSFRWVAWSGPVWTRDSRSLLTVARGHLWQVDAESGRPRCLSTHFDRLVTGVLTQVGDDALVTTVETRTGHRGFWWVSLTTGQWRRGHEAPMAMDVDKQAGPVITLASHGAKESVTTAFVGSTLDAAPNVYVQELKRRSPASVSRKVTDNHVPVILPALESRVISYQTTPGLWGEMLLVRPAGVDKPLPTIVWSYPGYRDTSELAHRFGLGTSEVDVFGVLSRGFALLVVDVPLAKEYGARGPAMEIVDGMNRALDAAAATGWMDMDRLGVCGASFGGYMVNLLVARTQRFKAAVSIAGISDLLSLFSGAGESNPAANWQFRMEKTIAAAPERYVLNSPVLDLDAVTTPLLLLHGDRDNVVHISQAEEMFRALAQRGKTVELTRYHGQGHDLESPWPRMLEWFGEYLLPASDQASRLVSDSGSAGRQ